jgi:hypothetical protein
MVDEENCSVDSSNDFDNDGTGLVQLGFVEEENESEIEKNCTNCSRLKFPNWKKWDGGKAGGFPVMKFLTSCYCGNFI